MNQPKSPEYSWLFNYGKSCYNNNMGKQEILAGIAKELETISSENPRDFYYSIESYTDDYEEDSICALILKWNQLDYGNFDDIFPITAKMFAMLESVDDPIERSHEIYANIISMAKDALKEIKEYKAS